MSKILGVNSEINELQKVLIHSPDGGIGNVPANKLHEWLYDDIVDVKHIQKEYKAFQTLLLLFLDPEKLFDNDNKFVINTEGENSLINNPEKRGYYAKKVNLENEKVIDTQYLLQYLLEKNKQQAHDLIVSICAIESVHPIRKKEILDLLTYANKQQNGYCSENEVNFYAEIVKIFLTGKLEFEPTDINTAPLKLIGGKEKYIFPPIPNFIFTRDIGITIGDYLLITKPRFYIRKREVILLRFIAENFSGIDSSKIIAVSEDDNFFNIEEENQKDYMVNYEGGDIMMISDRHVLIGCSERTSAYATQKLVNRLFWEKINTGSENGIDIISIIMIGEKRSQMHIDTILSHLREDVWVIHSPLSEKWEKLQENKDWFSRNYNDELLRKSEHQIEKEKNVSITQFYLNKEGKDLKKIYYDESSTEQEKKKAKYDFKKLNFLRKIKKDGDGNKVYNNSKQKIHNKENNEIYTKPPEGLADLLSQISLSEYGVEKDEDVKFILSGKGTPPYDSREQWTDACNLLTLSPGISVGYDRNLKTASHFNELLKSDNKVVVNENFDNHIKERNKVRFRSVYKDDYELIMNINHVLHVNDLFDYIVDKSLTKEEIQILIKEIKKSRAMLILLPSNELSRARGGSHCMSMPLNRKSFN